MEINRIIRHLDAAFEGIQKLPSSCISTHHAKAVFIYDPVDANRTGIVALLDANDLQADKLFTIRNRNETEFAVWAFDGCMDFREFEGALLEKACEAVVFNERIISWIELKMEAQSFTIASANNLISKACKQLLISVLRVLDRLEAHNAPVPWSIFQAYIGTPSRFPRRSGSKSLFATQLRELGVELLEINVLHLQ
jgi:hypothetical protein